MAKTIHITLSGEAQELVEQLKKQGLSEQEIIAKALTLLKMAQESQLAQVDTQGQITGTLRVS